MADKIVISTELSPYDGEYEFELGELLGTLTNRELHRIKILTGLRAGEIGEAFAAEDSDVIVALTVVILERKGKSVIDDLIWDAPLGAIKLDLGAEESPPEETQETPESEPQTSEQSASSGSDSKSDSDHLANGQSSTGQPHLVTPLAEPDSDPLILAN